VKKIFQNWPDGLARQGIVITAFDEQIPFSGFMCSDDALLLQRKTPDSMGARMMLLSYDQVVAIKIVEIVGGKPFRGLGFEGTLPKR